MSRTHLLFTLLTLSSLYSVQAQDPGVGGLIVTSPLAVSAVGTVKANFFNGSSTPIPQANNATWTVNLPQSISVTGSSISPAAANITTTVGTYSPTAGTIVTLVSNLGNVPGNAVYTLTLNVIGVQSSTNVPVSISASSIPASGTNLGGNDSTTISGLANPKPLPVALVSFSANANTQHTVNIAWTTSLETNNKGFQLDRSKDLIHFETVGQIPSEAVNSQALKQYQFTDLTPFTGTSYYRLTQTDLSGKATVYPAVSVVMREEAYGVYPNPVTSEGAFELRLDEPQTAILGLFNPQGRAIPLQKMGVQSGNLLLKTSGSLSAGVYVLTVEERGQTRQHRLVVQ